MSAPGPRAALAALALLFALPAMAQDDPITISVAPFGDPSGRAGTLGQDLELELELDEELLILPFADVKKALGRRGLKRASDAQLYAAMNKAGIKVLVRGFPDEREEKVLLVMYNAVDESIIDARTITIADHLGKVAALAQSVAETARDYDVVPPLERAELDAMRDALDGRRIEGGDGDGDGEDGSDTTDASTDSTTTDGSSGSTSDPDSTTSDPDSTGDDTTASGSGTSSTDNAPDDSATGSSDSDGATGTGDGSSSGGRLGAVDEEREANAKDDDEETYLFDRLVRFTLRWSPPFVSYQACQPDGGLVPFFCQAGNIPPQGVTLVPWLTPASGGFSLELTPWVRWVGFQLEASAYRTVVPVYPEDAWRTGSDNDPTATLPSGPGHIAVMGGDMNAFASAQGAFAFGLIGVSVGGRAGLLFNWAMVEGHVLRGSDAAGNYVEYDVTLMPGTLLSINPAIGAHGALFVGRWVRVAANVDVTPVGYQLEMPNALGSNPLTLAGHGKLQVDVDPIFGIVFSVFLDGVAVSMRTSGTGTRYNRGLVRFNGGQADMFVLKGGLGVGYHF